jgi:O-antigen/teichoic acid export membrane protein
METTMSVRTVEAPANTRELIALLIGLVHCIAMCALFAIHPMREDIDILFWLIVTGCSCLALLVSMILSMNSKHMFNKNGAIYGMFAAHGAACLAALFVTMCVMSSFATAGFWTIVIGGVVITGLAKSIPSED